MHKRIDPFEFLYYVGSYFKKSYLLSRQKRLPCKVVSIGNITTGGTGKTSAAIALAQEAKKRGFQPVILTSGYEGKAKEPVLINFPLKQSFPSSKTAAAEISPEMLGDDAFMMAEKLKEVPIVKFPDRYKGGMLAYEALKAHFQNHRILFILDDGFQHWALYRDIDLVLVDGINAFGNRKMLPFGVLKELPRELNRADILLITKRKNEELFSRLKLINPKAPIFYSEYKARDIRHMSGGSIPFEELKNKKLYPFCGIAQPESFMDIVSSFGADTSYPNKFPDHYRYKEKDILKMIKQSKKQKCDFLITTEKDIEKIRNFKALENILYVEIEFSVDPGFYDKVFNAQPASA